MTDSIAPPNGGAGDAAPHDVPVPPEPQTSQTSPAVVANPWHPLRRLTPARIALGRSGASQPTSAQLDFQLANAQARDAVHQPLAADALCAEIEALGLPSVLLHSAAGSRAVYLQRPDLGRRLDERSLQRLAALRDPAGFDIGFVVADGLSALAVQRHAPALLGALLPLLRDLPGSRIAPVAVVEQGRVAVGDAVGHALGCRCIVVLIGERPGLSSPDSLGIYLTWDPRPGRNDAQRNCVSNVRPEGLTIDAAARRLRWLLDQAFALQLSGVELKDDSEPVAAPLQASDAAFLLAPPARG